jgi:hypothetical protein
MAADNYDLQVDMAKRIFLEYDQERLIRKCCLRADERYLYLSYLNTPCRIDRKTGGVEEFACDIWRECRAYETVMTVYDLLCHHKGDNLPALAGQWCTVGNFVVTGVTKTDTFTGKYAKLFDGRLEELKIACEKLGGVLQPAVAGADLTCRIPVTSFFPVLLQFWTGDEEFPPKLLILWDRNTIQFMHFETTFYLQGDLLSRLRHMMEGNK